MPRSTWWAATGPNERDERRSSVKEACSPFDGALTLAERNNCGYLQLQQ
ncbi:hypothetical protein ABZ826_34215 [Streptomyces sp. NPDC047515]